MKFLYIELKEKKNQNRFIHKNETSNSLVKLIQYWTYTSFSSSSKKFRILCCLTSALFFLDDTKDCGVQPEHLLTKF